MHSAIGLCGGTAARRHGVLPDHIRKENQGFSRIWLRSIMAARIGHHNLLTTLEGPSASSRTRPCDRPAFLLSGSGSAITPAFSGVTFRGTHAWNSTTKCVVQALRKESRLTNPNFRRDEVRQVRLAASPNLHPLQEIWFPYRYTSVQDIFVSDFRAIPF